MIKIHNFLNKLKENKVFLFLDQLIFKLIDDGIVAVASQQTYFLILSLFPFIILILNIISFTPIIDPNILSKIIYYLPDATQDIINGFVNDISIGSSQGLLSISAFLGIWTASSGIKAVMRAINKAYGYEEKRSFFKLKFLSILFTIALLILITLVFLTLVFGKTLGNMLFTFFGIEKFFLILWRYLRIIIPLLYMIFTFALLYKYSPCVKNRKSIKLRETLPGAIFTTLGWMIISILFSYYVDNFGRYAITYGSLVGVILLLIWLFISSFIIILGGEVNAILKYFKENSWEWNREKSLLKKQN